MNAEISNLLIQPNQDMDAKQAKVDELMLEYCPDEMTKEQLDNWAKHQSPVEEAV